MLKIIAASLMVCAFAGTAFAAPGWTFEKLSFAPREGWCPAQTNQDNAPALEIRPCEEDFPSLSLSIAQRNAARQDLAKLAATDAAKAQDAENQKRVQETVQARAGGECTDNSFAVQPSPIPGVAGFVVVASFICSTNEDSPAFFNVFTAYAQGRDGSVWTARFDHPGSPMSNRDIAMIKAAIARITGR